DCRLLEARGLAGTYHREARVAVYATKDFVLQRHGGVVAILAAGTSDLPVAEEARIVAEALGCEVVTRYDVGVAGLHRLLSAVERLRGADVYVAVAGREGALAPVVAGLVDKPVIGLPVSTGYGKGGAGEAALLSMLQSCAPLVTVNIDAGFVAGACAAQIARMVAEARRGVKS
ncbi:MAG: nickel pincer cofactor biosynthesis protein LarB, partial [Methanobacteriota archaeon]